MSKKTAKRLDKLFEKAARDTWCRLEASKQLGISQSETTITDIILLDLKAAKCPFLHLIKTPQHLESSQGTDWEWWIGATNIGWLRYAVQAKKVDFTSARYEELNHKVGVDQKLQLEILRSYSSVNKALGRYCFYNYVETIQPDRHWHCNLPFESTQLGCSIATLSTVDDAIHRRGGRNFDFIHRAISTRPFRCLVTCPIILSVYAGAKRFPNGFEDYEDVHIFESLPSNIREGLETGSFEEWDSRFYSNEIRYRPERILVAQLPYWSDRP
jgi:hypothetical protein